MSTKGFQQIEVSTNMEATRDSNIEDEYDACALDFTQMFPDTNLRAQVLTDFKRENPGNNALTSLTQTQVASIKTLGASTKSIANAAGVEYLTGATHIYLGGNQLTAPPTLTGLTNLQTMNLGGNQLTAPPDVTGLTNLQTLNLDNNQLTAPPDVTGLTNLQYLYLGGNQLTAPPDVTGLTRLARFTVAPQNGDNNVYRRTQIPGIMSTTRTWNPTTADWDYIW